MSRILITTIFLLLFQSSSLIAQMYTGTDTLYGNEWIQYDQRYVRFHIAADGWYRVSIAELEQAGIDLSQVQGSELELWRLGKRVPLYVNTQGSLKSSDAISFPGVKNRAELEQYMFELKEDILNPSYSLFTDTSAYYLTWKPGSTGYQFQETSTTNPGNLAPEPWFWFTSDTVLNSTHVKKVVGSKTTLSSFDVAEGFAGPWAVAQTINLTPVAPFINGPDAEAGLRIGTRVYPSASGHDIRYQLNGSEVGSDAFNDYGVRTFTTAVNTGDLSKQVKIGVEMKTIQPNGVSSKDMAVVSTAWIKYPRTFNFSGSSTFSFEVLPNAQERLIEVEGFDSKGQSEAMLYVWSGSKALRLRSVLNGSKYTYVLPASDEPYKCWMVSEAIGQKVSTIQAVSFKDYIFSEPNTTYLILTHEAVRKNKNGVDMVQEYANYRATERGGNHKVSIVDVRDLYEQFGYGIQRTPLSISNFLHFARKQWPGLKGVFLIGKAQVYPGIRAHNATNLPKLYVPTWGATGSDVLLASDPITQRQILPVGRLAVTNGDEIEVYLNKVREHETTLERADANIQGRAWMKRIMHLSGGQAGPNTDNSAPLIASFMSRMAENIERSKFGADVSTFYKSSNDPVQISTSEKIFNLINEGVSVITFMGHASEGTFDFNIDNPENYNNKGKYPLMISLGCYVGNIHLNATGVSERFVLRYGDKGAIAFLASTGEGSISNLYDYANKFYASMGGSLYGGTLGEIQLSVNNIFTGSGLNGSQVRQQQTLHGDPAIRLYAANAPDYTIDGSSFKITPENVDTETDSITLNFKVYNIGKSLNNLDLDIRVEQTFPNGSKIIPYIGKIVAPAFVTEASVKIPVYPNESVGANSINVQLDYDNNIPEAAAPFGEQNNDLVVNGNKGYPLFISDNSILPAYPNEFGIVSKSNFTFVGYTANPIQGKLEVVLELDTLASFASPGKQRIKFNNTGRLVQWVNNFSLQDGQTYYWRISRDSINPQEGFRWRSQNFTYHQTGTNAFEVQSYEQLKECEITNMQFTPKRKLEYLGIPWNINIKNKVWDDLDRPFFARDFQPLGSMWPWTINEGIVVGLHNTDGAFVLNSASGRYGSVPRGSTGLGFSYRTDTPANRKKLMDALRDSIPTGYYVFLYTTLRTVASDIKSTEWALDSLATGEPNLFNVLESFGARKVRSLATLGSVPYVFGFRKGAQVLGEDIASDVNGIADMGTLVPRPLNTGNVEFPVAGPAVAWKDLTLTLTDVESSDSVFYTIHGLDRLQKNDSVLFKGIYTGTLDLSVIDAKAFPYLRTSLKVDDKVNKTPVQIRSLGLDYTPAPDLVVIPGKLEQTIVDTIAQGQNSTYRFQVFNASTTASDSFNYELAFPLGSRTDKLRFKSKGSEAFSFIDFEHVLQTNDFQALQTVETSINPSDSLLEDDYRNNLMAQKILVEKDKINPVIDLTINGRKLLNGDIISPNSQVKVRLSDENQYRPLTDTNFVKVYLLNEAGVTTRLFMNDSRVQYTLGTTQKNVIDIIWAMQLQDGEYTIVVQAQDASGNQSGKADYKVSFKVISEKRVSRFYNYPNPFSNATRFVYTLTGDAPPTEYNISIYTMSGVLVRTLTARDLGPLQVGNNLTVNAWDGTDEWGNKLANGVYLYKVTLNDPQNDFKNFQVNDKEQIHFESGFGKMVILR